MSTVGVGVIVTSLALIILAGVVFILSSKKKPTGDENSEVNETVTVDSDVHDEMSDKE